MKHGVKNLLIKGNKTERVFKVLLLIFSEIMISWFDLWQKEVVFAAGMQRSASTLLYNIIRLILAEKYEQEFYATWINDYKRNNYSTVLIKNHSMHFMQYWLSKNVFFSYRDIRTVAYSNYKIFNQMPNFEFCRQQIEQYNMAKKHKAHLFSFEALTEDTVAQIEKIASILKINVAANAVLNQIPFTAMQTNGYDKTSLLHYNHIQNIKPIDWQTNLDEKLVNRINIEFKNWFKEVNYVI